MTTLFLSFVDSVEAWSLLGVDEDTPLFLTDVGPVYIDVLFGTGRIEGQEEGFHVNLLAPSSWVIPDSLVAKRLYLETPSCTFLGAD